MLVTPGPPSTSPTPPGPTVAPHHLPHAPRRTPSHLQFQVSPVLSPPGQVLAAREVRSPGSAMVVGPEQRLQGHSRPSPHPAPLG